MRAGRERKALRERPVRWPWEDRRDPASGDCEHSFSNWSAPVEIEVNVSTAYPSYAGVTRAGWVQDRHCLKCNLYERRLT